MQRQLSLVLFLVVFPVVCQAQGGESWWRQLFKSKQAVPSSEENLLPSADVKDEAVDKAEFEALEIDTVRSMDNELGAGLTDDRAEGFQGHVTWRIPGAIMALDSGRTSPDLIRIPGFRVQLFMGKLDSARSLKRSLEEADSTLSVHLTPYPPLFGVTLGNFRTSLAAYRVLETWKRRFPYALVVPLGLPLDAVYPTGEVAPYGAQMTPTNRD